MFNLETGWIAKISEEFTFDNVRKAARDIAQNLKKGPVIVGYDSRFLADRFAEEVVKVAESAGISCLFTERDTPTPVVAWEVKDKGAVGGVMITGGSSPPEFCGIKFIKGISGNIREYQGISGKVERFEPRERYLKYLEAQVDLLVFRRARLKIVVDPMYGSGRGYLDKLLQRLGCQVEEIHGYRDVLFGGKIPDPKEENLTELKAKVVENKADLGLALNGDASTFAWVDRGGKYHPGREECDAVLEGLLLCYNMAKGS